MLCADGVALRSWVTAHHSDDDTRKSVSVDPYTVELGSVGSCDTCTGLCVESCRHKLAPELKMGVQIEPEAMSTEGELSLATTMAVWLSLLAATMAWFLYRSVMPCAAPTSRTTGGSSASGSRLLSEVRRCLLPAVSRVALPC
jgi:hypothetical protein